MDFCKCFNNFAAKSNKLYLFIYMIVKRRTINILLGLVVLALAVAIVSSIMSPINFKKEAKARENKVIERLQKIRSAEARYRQTHDGIFCTTLDSLVLTGYIADSLKYIPYSGGKQFELSDSYITTNSGNNVHVIECRAYYDDYLKGLDEDLIAGMKEEALAGGGFPGVKFGDLTLPSDNRGNWE